jgi:transcriptional regulator with XRE-family HTH domain
MSAQVRLCGRLIEARKAIGKSQHGLADATGISVSTISRIESAERMPSALQLMKLLAAFCDEGLRLDEGDFSSVVKEATGIIVTFTEGRPKVSSSPSSQVKLSYDRKGKLELNNRTFRAITAASETSVYGMPDPHEVMNEEDLLDIMKRVWSRSGYRSAREMQELLARYHATNRDDADRDVPPLSKSTLNTMCRATSFPKLENFKAFLVACGVQSKLKPWTEAWHRADDARTALA